ncbi:autoinducer binding domain-containing protein [Rhizobium laguerreae]|uniref:autoinducer binding domain-containing protein n=1 Tax=Rhizobium laguerreae TaxID=1076926 RepID=UPI0028A8E288|nr:autoinducer binding domain-containing protein [Rhizobium laguerreae]
MQKHRHFGQNNLIERLRKAVPFDYIFIAGLDVDHYRFGPGFSIDTDLPPAFVKAYMGDNLPQVDPLIAGGRRGAERRHARDAQAGRERH